MITDMNTFIQRTVNVLNVLKSSPGALCGRHLALRISEAIDSAGLSRIVHLLVE